ncbi:MAG: hypothetical protein COA86_17275 [Kangiella sp.]|nr:MAG: hypothetical protein COA86_17275 [Kangiella sp.]
MITLEDALVAHSRVSLTNRETPLEHFKNLSEQLNFNLFVKRDDLTDLALGGDKPYKLEYEIAKAIKEDANILVTCGSSQSNHARLTTAAARKLGMECAVVLSRDQWQATQGNLLTVYMMGAQVKVVDVEDHWDLEEHARELCDSLSSQGYRPYYIPVSGSTTYSCLGYVRESLEIIKQLDEQNIKLDAIYTPFGTGGNFASILFAIRDKGFDCPVIGISVNRNKEECEVNLNMWWQGLCGLLQRDSNTPKGHYELYDQFVGEEYGVPTEAGLDAILTVAQGEGVLLDPVYSGKAFSGLLSHAKEGRWKSNHNILFIHTGGTPAIFAYSKQIEAHLIKRGVSIAP